MPVTGLRGRQILDGDVVRADLNTTTAGSAVIQRIIAGTNISITSTGVDSGTGDVTISATGGSSLNGTGFVRMNGTEISYITGTAAQFVKANGTLDSNVYLTGNQSITLSGDATGSGSTAITVTLANSGVTAGTYRSVTVDAKGRVTAGTNPTTLSGYGITDALSNSTTSTQSGYFGDIFLFDDSTPSHYLAITNSANLTAARTLSINVNDADRTISLSGNLTVSAAATVSGTNTGDQTITLTGDVTGSGTGSFAATLANSGVTAGTYRSVTVDAKGRVTAGSNPTTLSGYGITDAVPSSRTITINGTAFDLSANRSWTITATETDTLATVTGRGATTSNTIQVGKLGIGRAAASNESIAVDNPEGLWLIQGYRGTTGVGGLHTNSGILHLQANSGAEIRLETSGNVTWSGNIIATRSWVQAQGYVTGGPYLPLSGGTMTGAIIMSGTQQIRVAGFAGIEYYNGTAQWQGYIGTENNTGNLRYNSFNGAHTWYANSTQTMSLNSSGVLTVAGYLRTAGVGGNTVLFNGGASSVDFGNVLGQGTSSRSTMFRGSTSSTSVWWGGTDGNGSNIPFAAIDATAGEFTFWRNTGGTGGGSWTNIMTMNASGLTMVNGNFVGTLIGSITGNAATVTNGVYTNANNSLTGGNRIVIQASQDGGNSRGIFMWNGGDSNWGIYMAQAGAGRSLSDATAPAGLDGRTEHAIRFRVANSTTQPGFIWENSSNATLMQLQPNTGNLYITGRYFSQLNTASGLGNLGFQTSAGTIGNIHIQNGAGPGDSNSNQAAITFMGSDSSQAQAGIYVLNNNSYGTSMGFATTNSYAAGPQIYMTASNGGVVNFTRANPTVQGNGIWHAGNLTNLNQLTNGPGYVTGGPYLPTAGGTMTGTITITSTDIRSNATSGWTGDPGTQGKIQYHANRWYIVADQNSDRIVQFRRNGADVSHIDNSGVYNGSITGTAGSETLSTVTSRGNSTGSTMYIDAAGEGFAFRTNTGWGGWARNTHVISTSANTVLAAFGGFGGSGTSLSYSYIGLDYLNTWIRFSSSAVNSQVALQQGGNQVWHAGNLTNLNQLSNGPGYITGINGTMVTNALGYTPFNTGSWGGNYFYDLSWTSTSTGTRYRVGRVYYNACHWGNYGVMKIKVRNTYYNGGYIEWTISNGPGEASIKTTDHSLRQTGSFNCFLGSPVQQGSHAGCNTFYREIFIELGPYIGVNVDFTWNAQTNIDSNDGGNSQYANFVIYTGGNRTVTNQGITSPLVEYRAPRVTADTLAVNTTDPAVNGLVADFNGAVGIRTSNRLYFGHSNNNFNSWSTAIYASGSTMLYNAQTHIFNNEGYGSTFSTTINASGISSSNIVLNSTDTTTPINIIGATHKYLTINPGNGWEAMVRYIGGAGSSWFVGKRTSGQTVTTSDFHFFSEAAGTTVVGIDTGGNIFAKGGLYFERGDGSFTSFVRAQNHPDQGYTASNQRFWVELGSFGGVHVTLNMDGGANDGQNNFDHFTIWQAASNSTSGSRQFYVTNIGNVWARNDITAFSDARVKENIRPIENALEKVVKSRGVLYDRIDTGEKNGIGFIAQELEEQLPNLVKTDDKGFKSVKYQNMVAVLTEAIKEQQAQIEDLKNQITELKENK